MLESREKCIYNIKEQYHKRPTEKFCTEIPSGIHIIWDMYTDLWGNNNVVERGLVRFVKNRAPNGGLENWLKRTILIRNTLLNDSFHNTILNVL